MPKLTFVTFFLVVGAVQGLFLSMILYGIKKKNKGSNKLLSFFVLLISLTMIGGLIARSSLIIHFPNLLAFPDAVIFLYGPFLYLYLKRLFLKETKSLKIDWFHFIPAFAFMIFELFFLIGILNKGTRLYGVIVEGSAVILNLTYLFLSFRLHAYYVKQSNNRFSFRQYPAHLKTLLIILVIIMILWIYAYLSWVVFINIQIAWISYAGIWISLAFITYVLAYFSIKQPDLYRITLIGEFNNLNSESNGINNEIIEKIEKIILDNKPYLNPVLSLPLLSEIVNLKPHLLSKIINEYYHKNFSDFINEFRIQEFLELVQRKGLRNYTILALALKAGFNSKTTFNSSFRKIKGKTPKEYLKNINS